MLDEVLGKKKVKEIINNIKNVSEKEKSAESINYKLFANQEKILFIFYDALLKYKIIIDEEIYFDDYLEQIDKLLKKINNIDDLTLGVNNLICKFTCIKLGVKNNEEEDNRKDILTYIYNKFIVNGYFVHGFSSCYCENIKRYGFTSEAYLNYYEDFKKINDIFNKYNITNVLEKDFSKKEVHFTDNFVKACSYSANSPGYFFNLIYNREYNHLKLKKDILVKGNFEGAFKNIKRILNFLEINDEDKAYIIDIFKKEWNLLFSKERKISLLLVKRGFFPNKNGINILDLVSAKDIGIYEAVDKLLSERNSKVVCDGRIEASDLKIITLDGLCDDLEEDTKLEKMDLASDFSNVYGNVSLLLLVGSILISLGVIVSIILMIGG